MSHSANPDNLFLLASTWIATDTVPLKCCEIVVRLFGNGDSIWTGEYNLILYFILRHAYEKMISQRFFRASCSRLEYIDTIFSENKVELLT